MFGAYYKHTRGLPHMSVSHVSHDEPTRVDVWTVLKELPQRIQALLKRHDASQELGFEELEHELHALFTHAECAATSEALERHDVDLPHVFIDAEKHHPGVPVRKDLSLRGGPGDGDAHAVSGSPGRAGGRCDGAQGRHRRRVLDAACGASGRDADRSPGAARGRGGVGCVGQHDALEELAGPTAQGALGALGGAAPPVRGEGARGDAQGRGHGVHRGGLARRGDGADEDGGRRVPGGELRLGVVV